MTFLVEKITSLFQLLDRRHFPGVRILPTVCGMILRETYVSPIFFRGKTRAKGGHLVLAFRITGANLPPNFPDIFCSKPSTFLCSRDMMPKRLPHGKGSKRNSNHSHRAHGVQVGIYIYTCIYIYIFDIYTAQYISKNIEIHLH